MKSIIAGPRDVELVGACEPLENPEAPVWSSVHLEYVEALGGGTLTFDDATSEIRVERIFAMFLDGMGPQVDRASAES